ncbi:MAG: hypothetical protein JKY60_01445 [Kordiimonadaceae bacterium]|nr:hypothetical protein [Kordiimonadaceae bacterium]
MFSPRFQMGAGRSLRISLIEGDISRAAGAYTGIFAGTEAIAENGTVGSRLPLPYARRNKISEGDKLSAAAFYLGDACLGIMALEQQPRVMRMLISREHAALTASLKGAAQWLYYRRSSLQANDSHAPNRLLFDALAFQACGTLTNDRLMKEAAAEFATYAISSLTDEGFFIESGGWDTSYQGVAVRVGSDLVLAGLKHPKLTEALQKATSWLSDRIRGDGSINSQGNTRTCTGGEAFLGKLKKVDVTEVFLALAYQGSLHNDLRWLGAAERVSKWVQANPGNDPCFPRAVAGK